MPRDLIIVESVLEAPTRVRGVVRWDVVSRTTEEHIGTTYETTNPWLASLCEQAWKVGKPLYVGWKDSRYGKMIVTLEFA